jgi:hypothetical protein
MVSANGSRKSVDARLGRESCRPAWPLVGVNPPRPVAACGAALTQSCHFMGKQSDGTSRDLSQLHPRHATQRLTLPLREYAG